MTKKMYRFWIWMGLFLGSIPQLFAQTVTPDQELDNMATFGEIFGLIRYFHPADQAQSLNGNQRTNWNYLASIGADQVRTATTTDELVTRLTVLFTPLSPLSRIWKSSTTAPTFSVGNISTTIQIGVAKRFHAATNFPTISGFQATQQQNLVSNNVIPSGYDDPRTPPVLQFPSGVSAYIPSTVFTNFDSGLTFPSIAGNFTSPYIANVTATTKGTSEGTVIVVWNLMRHFYPLSPNFMTLRDALKMLRDQGLNTTLAALTQGLKEVRVLSNEEVAMAERFLFLSDKKLFYYPPFSVDWIENQLVVTRTQNGVLLERGEIITQIDGQTPQNRLSALQQQGLSRTKALTEMLRSDVEKTWTLEVQHADGSKQIRTVFFGETQPLRENTLPPFYEIRNNLIYFDLTQLTPAILANHQSYFASRDAIIDLRNSNRNVSMPAINEFFSHIFDAEGRNVSIQINNMPIVQAPFTTKISFGNATQTFPILPPYYRPPTDMPDRRFIFLINEHTEGQLETLLQITRNSLKPSVIFVGNNTSGENTAFVSMPLPALNTQLNFNASQTLGTPALSAVSPHQVVTRTIRGVRGGRDEVLNKAIQMLTGEVVANEKDVLPNSNFALLSPFPNPVSQNAVQIPFSLKNAAHLKMEVFNAMGAKITTLTTENFVSGVHQVEWQPANIPNGVYFIRAAAHGQTLTKSVTLLR